MRVWLRGKSEWIVLGDRLNWLLNRCLKERSSHWKILLNRRFWSRCSVNQVDLWLHHWNLCLLEYLLCSHWLLGLVASLRSRSRDLRNLFSQCTVLSSLDLKICFEALNSLDLLLERREVVGRLALLKEERLLLDLKISLELLDLRDQRPFFVQKSRVGSYDTLHLDEIVLLSSLELLFDLIHLEFNLSLDALLSLLGHQVFILFKRNYLLVKSGILIICSLQISSQPIVVLLLPLTLLLIHVPLLRPHLETLLHSLHFVLSNDQNQFLASHFGFLQLSLHCFGFLLHDSGSLDYQMEIAFHLDAPSLISLSLSLLPLVS